jgi:hypothetical protein
MDNPFTRTSRSYALFDVLANADRPLRAEEIATAVGEANPGVAHSMLKDLRHRGLTVYRYRDPQGTSPSASVYSLRPVDGMVEFAAPARNAADKTRARPTPVQPGVRQPEVGSVARVVSVVLADETLYASIDCDGVMYRGTVAAQPTVGEWMTLVTVGLHGQGLYVDLAGARVLTVENIVEVRGGDPPVA